MSDNSEHSRKLKLELEAIEAWELLWNNDDEHARKARQMRREEIVGELSLASSSVEGRSSDSLKVPKPVGAKASP